MLNSFKCFNRTDSLISLIEADLKHGKPDVCITSSQVDNDAPSLLSSQSDDIGLGKDEPMQPGGHWSLCESCHNIIVSSLEHMQTQNVHSRLWISRMLIVACSIPELRSSTIHFDL